MALKYSIFFKNVALNTGFYYRLLILNSLILVYSVWLFSPHWK